jgi:hypothetical protein
MRRERERSKVFIFDVQGFQVTPARQKMKQAPCCLPFLRRYHPDQVRGFGIKHAISDLTAGHPMDAGLIGKGWGGVNPEVVIFFSVNADRISAFQGVPIFPTLNV